MGFTRWKQAATNSRQVWHQSFEQTKFDMGVSTPASDAFLRQSLAAAPHWQDVCSGKSLNVANQDGPVALRVVARA